jgi:hypothetical protein
VKNAVSAIATHLRPGWCERPGGRGGAKFEHGDSGNGGGDGGRRHAERLQGCLRAPAAKPCCVARARSGGNGGGAS